MKRFFALGAALALLLGMTLFGAASASADDAYETDTGFTYVQQAACTSATCFALVCDFPSGNARARVDFTNIVTHNQRSKIDADDAWYRSLKTSTNGAATFTPDLIQIDKYDANADVGSDPWSRWTYQGGGLDDGVSVPASKRWDPSSNQGTFPVYTMVRMQAWSLGGQYCRSASRNVS